MELIHSDGHHNEGYSMKINRMKATWT